jgi:hypothetical protein
MTVWRDGKLILYLIASKGPTDKSDHIEWVDSRDKAGNHWGFRVYDHCGKVTYLNSIQSKYDWRDLTTVSSHTMTQKDGGYCTGEKKNEQEKCTDAKFWESTYTDPAVCGGYANPSLCSYKQYCVSVSGVPECTNVWLLLNHGNHWMCILATS